MKTETVILNTEQQDILLAFENERSITHAEFLTAENDSALPSLLDLGFICKRGDAYELTILGEEALTSEWKELENYQVSVVVSR